MKAKITWKRCVLALVALVVAFVVLEAFAWLRPKPRLEIGRDTTWLTGPLDSNGDVDYDAAWRAEHSPGVTAANNAAPPIYAAMGFDLSSFTAEERAAVPKVGQPITDFAEWALEHGDQFEKPSGPDHDAESEARQSLEAGKVGGPQERAITAWFDSIGPTLSIVQDATGRERFYASDGAPRGEQSIRYWAVLEVAKALAYRASRRANSSDWNGACTDLCTVLRLARLIRSMGGVVHCLVGTGCESCLWNMLRTIATDHPTPPADFVRRLFEARDTTPPGSTIEGWLAAERIGGLRTLEFLREHDAIAPFRVFSRLDPNRFNRGISAWADRVAAAWTDSRGWASRLESFDTLYREARSGRSSVDDHVIWKFLRGPASTADCIASYFGSTQVTHATIVEEFIVDLANEDRLLSESAAATFAEHFGRDPSSSDELTPYVFPTPFRDRLFGSGVQFTRDVNHALVAKGELADLLGRIEVVKNRSK